MPLSVAIPSNPGSYILELFLEQPTTLQTGRLGKFTFPAGVYLYFGSAWGPGGLRARLGRHLRPASMRLLHWHIDYLSAVADLRAVGYLIKDDRELNPARLECLWSQAAASLPGSLAPAPGFGASDCQAGCPAHLLFIAEPEATGDLVLFDHSLRDLFANITGSAKAQQNFCWQKIDQSHIAPAVRAKTAGT
jgi:Uri superfamily endonuclease